MRRCLTRKESALYCQSHCINCPWLHSKTLLSCHQWTNHRHAIWITAGIATVTPPMILHIWDKVDDRLYTGRAMTGVHIDTSRHEITFKNTLPTSVSYFLGNILFKSLRLISSVGLIIHKFNNNGNPQLFRLFWTENCNLGVVRKMKSQMLPKFQLGLLYILFSYK